MATLEFVMALPLILLLMVGITWLAFSVIGQAEVLVQARNDAWRERFKDLAKEPLMFPSGFGDMKNPLYSTKKDYVAKTVSKTVNVSQVFDGVAGPSASVTVLAGSWDHRAMDLNSPPNFKLYVRAAGNAVTKELQTEISKLSNLVKRVQDVGLSGITEGIAKGKEAENDAARSESEGRAGSSEAEREKAEKKQKLVEEQSDLGGTVSHFPFNNNEIQPIDGGALDKTNDEITKLELDLQTKRRQLPLKDEEQEKKRLAELEKAERRLQFLKGKKERIEAQIRDNDEELQGYK